MKAAQTLTAETLAIAIVNCQVRFARRAEMMGKLEKRQVRFVRLAEIMGMHENCHVRFVRLAEIMGKLENSQVRFVRLESHLQIMGKMATFLEVFEGVFVCLEKENQLTYLRTKALGLHGQVIHLMAKALGKTLQLSG